MNNITLEKKAQGFMFDLIISIVLFLVVSGYISSFLSLTMKKSEAESKLNELQYSAQVILDRIINSHSMNISNTELFGFSDNSGIIQNENILGLENISYSSFKSKNTIEHEYMFLVMDESKNIITRIGNPITSKNAAAARRVVLTKNNTYRLELRLYEQ